MEKDTHLARSGAAKRARSRVPILAITLVFAALTPSCAVRAQAPDTFEVASIRA